MSDQEKNITPVKKKRAKKKAKAKPKVKAPAKEKKTVTAGDSLEFKKSKLTTAQLKEHSAFKLAGREEFTVFLRPKDAEWLRNYAAMTNGNEQTLLEWLVRAARNDDPTKGGTIGTIEREGNKLKYGAGGSHVEESRLPPVKF